MMHWISIVDEMEGPEIWNKCYALLQDGVTLRSEESDGKAFTKDQHVRSYQWFIPNFEHEERKRYSIKRFEDR